MMARRRIPFERKPDESKRNPNSLRNVINLIVNDIHGSSMEEAVRKFSIYGHPYGGTSDEQKRLNRKALKSIHDDETYITYWHIEAIAESLRLPTGVLLLFSRMFANARNENEGTDEQGNEKNLRLISGLRAICDNYDPDEPLDVETLEKWSEWFSEGYQRLL